LRDALAPLDRAWVSGLALFLLGLLAAGIRLATAGGDVTRFVDAGDKFVNPATAPPGLRIAHGYGYDGQFVYRLALRPWDLSRTFHGITLDSGLRRQRIVLPALGWLFSGGGQPGAVGWALLAVNLAALGVVGCLGALLLRDSGLHALWGVVPGFYFCTVYSLGLDLTEILGTAFLLGGLLLYRRDRYLAAGATLAVGVLTRETVLVLPAAIGLVRIADIVRRRVRAGRPDLAWVFPAAALVLWESVIAAAYGKAPLLDDSMNAGTPFVAVVRATGHWIRVGKLPQLVAVALLAAVVVAAVRAFMLSGRVNGRVEIVALTIATVLSLSLSQVVWNENLGSFRTLTEVWVLGTLIALPSTPKRWLAIPLVADTGLAVGLFLAIQR
jgi:hypothetical protein